MFMVCGEALMDVFGEHESPNGVQLDARIGGSPLNVAIGLARLEQPVSYLGAISRGFLGQRIHRALGLEGVDLSHAPFVDAPTTLGLVGLDAGGSASYDFYGHRCADRLLQADQLPVLAEEVLALHFGSYSMVVEPVGSTLRQLVEREFSWRVIAFDPNLRLTVEPDLTRWRVTVDWMAQRCHLLKVSAEDLEYLRPGRSHREVAAELIALGVPVVVVTLGGAGAVGFTRHDVVEVSAEGVTVVDTVGAGDTFQAAMLAWLAEQGLLSIAALTRLNAVQLAAALRFASVAAGITCTRRGADMPRRRDLHMRALRPVTARDDFAA